MTKQQGFVIARDGTGVIMMVENSTLNAQKFDDKNSI